MQCNFGYVFKMIIRSCLIRVVSVGKSSLPPEAENIIISVPAATAEQVLAEISKGNVKRVWLHKGGGTGASSPRTVEPAREKGLETVYDFPSCFFRRLARTEFTGSSNGSSAVIRRNIPKHNPEYCA